MKFSSIQKVIKIGDSVGVTLPAKDLRHLGVEQGDNIKISFEAIDSTPTDKVELVALTQKLIERHSKALKNLAER
jgi:antitoxin component of MazEF toxin-antitoxin module